MKSISTNPILLANTNREISQQQTWQPFGSGYASVYVDPDKRPVTPSPNQTTLPLQKKRTLEQFDIAAFDKKPADNTSLDISAEAAAVHKQYPSASTDASVNKTPALFQFSRENLTDTQRSVLEKLDSQPYCLARYTNIIGEENQLRPATLLQNGVPIKLYTNEIYTDNGDGIAITLDPKQFPPQVSYKRNVHSVDLAAKEKSLTDLAKPELHVKIKLQEHSERINQPIYQSASSGKIKIVEGNVYFTCPKKAKYNLSNPTTLNHNESLVIPFNPSDVQSILVPKSDFLLNLGTVLNQKSAYEKKHELNKLPITIYDIETGERIHCYEAQLIPKKQTDSASRNSVHTVKSRKGVSNECTDTDLALESLTISEKRLEQLHPFLNNLKGLKIFLRTFTGTDNNIRALQMASPEFFMELVLSLPAWLKKFDFKYKEEILNLFNNTSNPVDLKTLTRLIADGGSFLFPMTDKHGMRRTFIEHVLIKIKNENRNKKLDDDLIENHQKVIYTLLHHPQIKSQVSSIFSFNFIPQHLKILFFHITPDFIYQKILNLDILSFNHDWEKMDKNIYLHAAGYLVEKMDDSICSGILELLAGELSSAKNNTNNTKKNILNILMQRYSLHELESEILSLIEKKISIYFEAPDYLWLEWIKLGVDLKPLLNRDKNIEYDARNKIITHAAKEIYSYHKRQFMDEHENSEEFKNFTESLTHANNIPPLPDHLKEVELPKASDDLMEILPSLECLRIPFNKPLAMQDISDTNLVTRQVLDRYYRTIGPNKIVDIHNLMHPPRLPLHGCGHALRVSINIRLLMQLLEKHGLETISPQQKQLLQYAALYHDAAAEDVSKDREEIDSAHYFHRDMLHNYPPHYKADIEVIAEAMAHKEDDIYNSENDELPRQQRLYRRLLRFADRLDIGRCFSIPQDFPNFDRKTTSGEVDASLLDIDAEWLNNENFKKALVAGIHGLVDLAAVSGGATNDQRAGKSYLHNYQLSTNASDTLAQFFEKTPNPLEAMERLLDDNVRRAIAKQAGIRTCGDAEHLNCDQARESGVNFGYTRYIHNSYHDLSQIPLPKMGLCEKLMMESAPELLSPNLQSTIDGEVRRLSGGLKRNIGSPSQETLEAPEAQTFLKKIHGLDVVAEGRLREVIPAETEDGKPSYRYESIFTTKPAKPDSVCMVEDVQRP